ncbi:MAG: transcription elongation factor GreB [Rhodovarius sp.]|nr:transcription elongation factor GreB [Rhodovarius sp.]MCX7932130.1 transcription elongation factor GreB [Rhodovarius sp.]MDW8315415.1 transcription elongation factor GreB [Rhodovarius sp.]
MERDEEDEEPEEEAGAAAGRPVYLTPQGFAALQEELRRLWQEERPRVVEVVAWAASLGDRSENADYQYGKRRLREIDRRVRYLRKRLERAEVVDPARQRQRDRVFFGATVTYARADDSEVTVTIVGSDEADAQAGRISWLSPVARALLGRRVGEVGRVLLPGGVEEIEVVAIRYPDPP